MRFAAPACCFVALVVPACLQAADKVALRVNLQPGMSWTFDQSQDITSDNKATLNGQTQPFSTKMHSRRVGKAEVLTVNGGLPGSLRITFGEGCQTTMEAAGQQQRVPSPYAGKTVTVTRGADGAVTDDFNGGPVDPTFVNELHGMINQEEAMYPRQPVGIGEEWAGDPQLVSKAMQLQGDDRAGMTLKLLAIKDVGGRGVAEIKVSMALVRTLNGMRSKAILQGVALVDVQTGHAGKIDMKGTLESNGQQQGPGPNGAPVAYQVEGTGTMTTAMSSEITAGGGGGGGAAPAGGDNAAPPADGNPLGGNPLGGNPPGQAQPFAGKFSDGNLTLELAPANGAYGGTLTLGSRRFPAKAKANNQSLEGSFDSGGTSFPFTAKLDGNTLTLSSGGKTYTLRRAAVNPLGASGSAEPVNPPALASNAVGDIGTGAAPGGYSVVTATDAGKALSTRKAGANSVNAALRSTLADLGHYFDAKPHIASAYEDVRDRRSGGASFTAKLHGQPVKGLVSCRVDDKDAAVAVIYCKADAAGADWGKLMAAPAAGGAAAVPPLEEYRFPDGTGSIGLAKGWTTKATSCNGPVVVDGPAGQSITLGFVVSAVTPNSTAVRMNQQLNAQARSMGGRQLPLNLFVAPLTGPVEALNNLMPQISERNRQNGGTALVMDDLAQVRQIPPVLPGGRAAVCQYGLTTVKDGQKTHHHVMAQVEVDPLPGANDSFMFGLAGASAPDDSFDRDLPTMLAIMGSVRENAAVIAAQTRQQIDGQNQRFAAQQKAHRELVAAYDDYNKAQARNSVVRSRSVDDFDEVIRGYRTVEDTGTGYRGSVDLGNVDHVVDALNQAQPGRYRQIPLRDEADPLPPR